MYPANMLPDMWSSGDITHTTNDASIQFLEYGVEAESGVQKEKPKKSKPKTWQEKVEKKRDDNLRGFFGYD